MGQPHNCHVGTFDTEGILFLRLWQNVGDNKGPKEKVYAFSVKQTLSVKLMTVRRLVVSSVLPRKLHVCPGGSNSSRFPTEHIEGTGKMQKITRESSCGSQKTSPKQSQRLTVRH